ncbi:hypothetical protein PO909_031797 [Leuciscus waleckii]
MNNLQQENTEKDMEKINNLFHKLNLEGGSLNNLSPADVLQITTHALQSNESCADEELVQTFLQKLLMMNYRARYIKNKETSKQDQTKQGDLFEARSENVHDVFEIMSLSNKGTNRSDRIHPMDVQMAVFLCADDFLKQLMVTKLSQCQYALPLLVPNPFTHQTEFPLWTFRQINKSWKTRNPKNETISQTQLIYKAQTPMVFFFRFDSVSSSKSELMNSLINEKHNTFFHRNCPGSSRSRVLMDGVVEIAWFCPSGKDTDQFNDCVAFCNLHGDAGDHEKQLQILTEMSSVNVVLLAQLNRNSRSAKTIQNLYTNTKPLIFLFTEDESTMIKTGKGKYKIGMKDRNQSEVSENLRRAINDCLSESSSTFILEDLSKHSDIRVDEKNNEDCRRGREAAQSMISLLVEKDLIGIKESILPHQGKMNSHDKHEKMFFIKWLGNLLDEYTSADLSDIHHKYDEKWSKVLKLKEKHDQSKQLIAEQTELERISEDLQAAGFGLEHIMREIGQIYESCSSVKKNKKGLQVHFSSLPSLAAEMMISGFPLELMDGDAVHVPLIWISAVLDELVKKLGDQRVFVLSILGIQSSGKSTMLNAMFGLQFAVSAGRCTRGVFMQLVKVSDEMKTQMKSDYILVVDTEGLRALELAGKSTKHHDNELATFVVGLGHLTLINIFGENPSEMQDVLQIVVQALMRMKKVRLNPRCVFVHQNVSDVTAGEKNMEGRRRLQEKLDEMTKLAAKDEVYDADRFSDIIRFDVQNDVKYFAQLWEGSPPMAPPNPNYCENIQDLKKTIISHASQSDGIKSKDLQYRIKDLWEALLNERFVFSFRNSLQQGLKKKFDDKRKKHEDTLYKKSEELALKFKGKGNNEETLKKEFDLFWKEWMEMIITDNPKIKDIDIMRDVREMLSKVYESAPVDHWSESSEDNNIFTVPSYSDYAIYKTSKKGKFEAVKGVYKAVKETLGYTQTLSPEDEAQIRSLVADVAQKTNEMIKSFKISVTGYNKSYIQQVTDYIKARILAHEKGVKYVFKNEFFMDLSYCIFQKETEMITEQQRMFREANDPVLYLEKKREEYYSIFQKYCKGSTSAAIFGEIICQKLKEPIEQSVYKKTAKDLTDEIKSNSAALNGNRSKLEKHILKVLAKEEDFGKYINYIHNPRDYFKSFIRDEVSQYIKDNFSVSVFPKMKENIELLQQKIIKAARESTECVQANRGDFGLWKKNFTQKLSAELIFSEQDLSGVTHRDVEDFNILKDVITQELPAIMSDISRRFNTNTFPVNLDQDFRPEEILISHFCKCCWAQCPFCEAICTNTIENHDGDHSVPFHRVYGIIGVCFWKTTNLSPWVCTSCVASNDRSFHHDASDNTVLYKQYRTAGELPYWKWFVCRFQKDLEKHYEKTFAGSGKIPDGWRTCTKQEAIKSLDTYI